MYVTWSAIVIKPNGCTLNVNMLQMEILKMPCVSGVSMKGLLGCS